MSMKVEGNVETLTREDMPLPPHSSGGHQLENEPNLTKEDSKDAFNRLSRALNKRINPAYIHNPAMYMTSNEVDFTVDPEDIEAPERVHNIKSDPYHEAVARQWNIEREMKNNLEAQGKLPAANANPAATAPVKTS
ncbi:hypothetical protein PCE1_002059 [Barthelona sp. PCE]